MLLTSNIRPVLVLKFLRFGLKHIIAFYLQIFNAQSYIFFQNLSLEFILKMFVKFRNFQPRYSFKIYSYKIKGVVQYVIV